MNTSRPTGPLSHNLLPAVSSIARKFEERVFSPLGFLAVIVVFGVFLGLLCQVLPHLHDAARRNQCANNMKEIVLAFHKYHDEYGHFPPAYTVDKSGKPLHSWRVRILPYIEYNYLYEKIRLDEPWDSEHNRQFHLECPGIFICPHRGNSRNCYYSVLGGAQTYSMTEEEWKEAIFLVERKEPVNWMDPSHEISFETAGKGFNIDAMGLRNHFTGMNVAFGDGSVRYFTSNANGEAQLRTYLSKAVGDVAIEE